MLSKILFRWLPSSIVLLGLAGCAEFDQRKGLDPIIDGAAVQTASYRKSAIINALAEDAGYRAGEPVDYYKVAEAGFNYVDDQCRSYFDSLFFLDRRRDELKSGLATAGATTAAILSVTQASVPSLAIVAAAFGLASNATDIVAGTYLYGRPPATTQGFVEKLQLAYRDGAAVNRGLINSPTSAYYQIQRYLNLCLPPSIEAEITRQISSARAIAVSSGSGAFFDVQSFGPPASELPKVGVAPGFFQRPPPVRPREPVKPSVHEEPHLKGFITSTEKQMRAEELGRIQQNVLCVDETRSFDGPTRDGIKIFQGFSNLAETGQIEDLDRKQLLRIRGGCPDGAQNFFERGISSKRVIQLQAALNKRPEGQPIEENGRLDNVTRDKIAAVRRGLGLADLPSAKRQVILSLFDALGIGI